MTARLEPTGRLRGDARGQGGAVQRIQVVGLIGPPAAGKSAVARVLAAGGGGEVFRLRACASEQALAATATGPARQGWLDDAVVRAALAAFITSVSGHRPVTTVVCDNFPGNGPQVEMLIRAAHAASPGRATVKVVQLVADNGTLHHRACTRLVCAGCEQDLLGDPRLPAIESAPGSGLCARCEQPLQGRAGDAPEVLVRRRQRYLQNLPGIAAACAGEGVPLVRVDAARPLRAVVDDVRQVFEDTSLVGGSP